MSVTHGCDREHSGLSSTRQERARTRVRMWGPLSLRRTPTANAPVITDAGAGRSYPKSSGRSLGQKKINPRLGRNTSRPAKLSKFVEMGVVSGQLAGYAGRRGGTMEPTNVRCVPTNKDRAWRNRLRLRQTRANVCQGLLVEARRVFRCNPSSAVCVSIISVWSL